MNWNRKTTDDAGKGQAAKVTTRASFPQRMNRPVGKARLSSAASLQTELGSTRALACSDSRQVGTGRNWGPIQSLNGDSFESARVVGEGADHSTRGRVRSPSLPLPSFRTAGSGKFELQALAGSNLPKSRMPITFTALNEVAQRQ